MLFVREEMLCSSCGASRFIRRDATWGRKRAVLLVLLCGQSGASIFVGLMQVINQPYSAVTPATFLTGPTNKTIADEDWMEEEKNEEAMRFVVVIAKSNFSEGRW